MHVPPNAQVPYRVLIIAHNGCYDLEGTQIAFRLLDTDSKAACSSTHSFMQRERAKSDLFTGLVRSKRDAQNRSDHPPKPDNLINAAAYNVHRNGEAHPAVGSTW